MFYRLQKIVQYIKPYSNIADIGCDHGYLIKIANELFPIVYAQAIDNKKGPLNNAQKNLASFSNVEYTLASGFDSLNENVEVVIIAGIGGILLSDILINGQKKLKNIQRMILQPNRNYYEVRKTINKINWKIVTEEIIEENKKIYEIIVIEKGTQILSEKEMLIGPCLIKENNPLLRKKWQQFLKKSQNRELNEKIIDFLQLKNKT